MQALKRRINPITIITAWTVLMIMLTPVFMYISNIGASGGEQKPLVTLATMIEVTVYGAAIFSLLTPFVFKLWFKKNWYFVFVILFILIPVAIDVWDRYFKTYYNTSETNTAVNGAEIKTTIEYYDEFKTVRSISIWKNNKRDSVWKIFSKNWQIKKQQIYRNDTLISE
ncbi:hypothetical protein QTN47_21330 [Danxiaibacter flavus]|uniref:Uncharacterized protein n=1 Tax=Danxiaibacter flavus TaxID=3049108 RepID=A0ABV3ZKJ4_9BACT|nr:hypothetical protein QNM32_21335 [Chitinophagaceae bacterium DXS]